ncbi:MAG: hypothetical protein OEM38_08820 [Gammaproteobacteria bacterium]|nr:hypothetical protein [Gammaproteobacteria bacterium]
MLHLTKIKKNMIAISLFSTLFSSHALSTPNASINYYIDNRDFNTMGVTISSFDLPQNFSVWGFTDFNSDQNKKPNEDFTNSFSEYRLTNTKISNLVGLKGLGLQMEYNNTTPGSSDTVWRGGLTYKKITGDKKWIQLRLFPLQSNSDNQASIIYNFSILSWLKLTGFADYNIRNGAENLWVIEPQLNFKIANNTWFLLEGRYNGFQSRSPSTDGTGVAVGVQYDL